MASTILDLQDICYSYGEQTVFSQVNMKVFSGDFVAITGPNGSGKSTLLRTMLGELTPLCGQVEIFGQNVSQCKDWTKVGYVPQANYFATTGFPATAREIVTANLFSEMGFFTLPSPKYKAKALAALSQVGMEEYAQRQISKMSGGQQQRVMLARVLVSSPSLLILDEPTNGIDAKSVESLYQLLAQLNKEEGLTIIMVTHDLVRAASYVNRVFCLEEESMVELNHSQVMDEISHKHQHPHDNSLGGHVHGNI